MADSLDEAKAAFRTAWAAIEATVKKFKFPDALRALHKKGRDMPRPDPDCTFGLYSGRLPSPSPPRKQPAARGDEPRQSSTDKGAGDLNVGSETRRDARTVEIEWNSTFAHSLSGMDSRGVESRD